MRCQIVGVTAEYALLSLPYPPLDHHQLCCSALKIAFRADPATVSEAMN
jgi:hypothetical protein